MGVFVRPFTRFLTLYPTINKETQMNQNTQKFWTKFIFLSCIVNILVGETHAVERPITFLAFGDGGTGNSQQHRVANSMERVCSTLACDFAIMLGDNIYEDGVDNVDDEQFQTKFEEPYGPLAIPFYVALGNHDARGNTEAQIEYTQRSQWWNMPARYYEKNIDNLKLIGIDSNDFGDDQVRFVANTLANSNAELNIVYGHHPIYSYGSHGHTSYLVNDLLPVLCQYQNVIYISGHDHDLQVLDSGCGVPLFVSGAAAKLRDTGFGSRSVWSDSTYGYAIFTYQSGSLDVKYFSQNDDVLFEKVYTFADGQLTEKVVSFGDRWSYHDQNVSPGQNWMNEGFDDVDWSQGNGQLGYGDGDERTVIAKGSPSAYFRKQFDISKNLNSVSINARHDDGIAIWVNGSKVYEKYMDNGLQHGTYASDRSTDNELSSIDLDVSLLHQGTNTLAVMVKQRSATSSDLSFDLELIAGYEESSYPSSIAFGSDWSYHDLDFDPGSTWHQPDFDDGSWSVGRGQLGYGDNDEATELAQGSPSVYFRKKLHIDQGLSSVSLKVLHDDGVAVWINGRNVFRKYVDNGLNHSAYASTQSQDNEQSLVEADASLFHPGTNTVAVMVKQRSATSSDVSFDLELLPSYESEPLPESIAFGSSWLYRDVNSNPGSTWYEDGFNDSSWLEGNAQLGYGDGDEETLINRGSPSVYFRKKMQISAGVKWAQLKVRHDDGVAVWVNGQNVLKKYVDKGLSHAVYASKQSQDNELTTVNLNASVFRQGANTIAVQVKQVSANSSDVSFDLELLPFYEGNPPSDSNEITHIGTTEVRDSQGVVDIARPVGSRQGDLLVLFLHRTDDDLPLFVDGWRRVAECYKTDNGYQCATESDCTVWHNADFCERFGSKSHGHDLAQSVFVREVGANESNSYRFNLNRDSTGHPGWAILTALRGADTQDPVRDWSNTGCDKNPDSLFPSVYGQKGDMLLLSQSFDDAIAQEKFGAPSGTTTLGYVSRDDEAGFLFGGLLTATGQTGVKKTQGDGGPSCKDALVSLTVKPK